MQFCKVKFTSYVTHLCAEAIQHVDGLVTALACNDCLDISSRVGLLQEC